MRFLQYRLAIPNVTKKNVSVESAFSQPCVFKASEARLRKVSIEDLTGKGVLKITLGIADYRFKYKN